MVQNWQSGNEAEDLNSLFKVLAEVAPVNQVLLDQSEILQSDKCLYCGRKKRKDSVLKPLYDGQRITTDKQKKEITKKGKQASVALMNANPKSYEFDPTHLTVGELKSN